MQSNDNTFAKQDSFRKLSLNLSAACLLALFLSFVLLAGTYAAAVGFRDPDTCWLLALGRWISIHHALPLIDPFSSNLSTYAQVAKDQPLIQYQWLIELLFFQTWKLAGERGLLGLTALVFCTSLIAMPMTYFQRGKLVKPAAFMLSSMGAFAASLRVVTRPEIFSTLFFSLLIFVNLDYRSKISKFQKAFCLIASSLIMVVWCNSHMLFPIGPGFLSVYSAAYFLENYLGSRRLPENWRFVLVNLSLTYLATLVNPWGFGLWQYLMRLLVSPVSFENADHQMPDPRLITSQVLIAIFLFYIVYFCYAFFKKKLALKYMMLPIICFCLAALMSLKYAKLVPQSLLIAAAAASELSIRLRILNQSINGGSSSERLWQDFLNSLEKICGPLSKSWVLTIALICLIGAFQASSFRQAELPETTEFFKPPFKAIDYLNKHPQKGRLLNEPLYGSVMTWKMSQPPNLFMDSRFSMFEPELVEEFTNMLLCEKNWQELINKHEIDWIFVPVKMPLAIEFSKSSAWQQIYKDEDAVILKKKETKSNALNQKIEK